MAETQRIIVDEQIPVTSQPFRGVHSPLRLGWHLLSSLRYFSQPEVHVYASSIAANALLSFFPFVLILMTVCQRWLRWDLAYEVVLQFLRANLPTSADFVVRNLVALAQGHRRLQIISVVMLLFTSSGIFLPLEIALNRVWGIERNRSYLRNQMISFGLALSCTVIALFFVVLTATSEFLMRLPLRGLPGGAIVGLGSRLLLEVVFLSCTVTVYFVTYFMLPNGQLPLKPVFAAAILAGLATEIGKFVYLLTLPLLKFREVYGPLTLPVALLFWAFLGALVVLWGAHVSAQIYNSSEMPRNK